MRGRRVSNEDRADCSTPLERMRNRPQKPPVPRRSPSQLISPLRPIRLPFAPRRHLDELAGDRIEPGAMVAARPFGRLPPPTDPFANFGVMRGRRPMGPVVTRRLRSISIRMVRHAARPPRNAPGGKLAMPVPIRRGACGGSDLPLYKGGMYLVGPRFDLPLGRAAGRPPKSVRSLRHV